jgi:hypothetical protein
MGAGLWSDGSSLRPKLTGKGQSREGHGHVYERLDRASGNQAWRLQFPEMRVKVLPRIKFDYHPILVEPNYSSESWQGSPRPFRFEAAWTTRKNFAAFLNENWQGHLELHSSLKSMALKLQEWNIQVFGNIFFSKEESSSSDWRYSKSSDSRC